MSKNPSTALKTSTLGRRSVSLLFAGVTLAMAALVGASTSTQVKQLDPLVVPRTAHVATALADGRILITGGRDSSGNIVAVSEIFDPATGTSTASATLTTARVDHTATLLHDGKVLVAGGSNGTAPLDSAEIFDPANAAAGFHVVAATMSAARAKHTATLLNNGTVLIAGGEATGTAEIFDPANETFSPTLWNLTVARSGHTATLFTDNSVLLVGGGTNSMELFTPLDQKFTVDAATMSVVRTGHWAFELSDTRLLLFQGDTGNTIDEFNPTTDTITPKGSLDFHASSSSLLANGKVLVLSAGVAGLYDPDAVPPAPDFSAFDETSVPGSGILPRSGQSAVELSGDKKIFVAGGVNAQNLFQGTALFNPARIWSDKDDYLPGDNVILSGSGWKANENIYLYAVDDTSQAWTYGTTVAADGTGGFVVDPYFVVQLVQLGANFTVTSVGAQSAMQAEVKFTDSVSSVTIVAPNGFPAGGYTVTSGGTLSVPYAFTYATSGTGPGGNTNPTTSITYHVYLRNSPTDYEIASATVTGLTNGTHAVGTAASPILVPVSFNGSIVPSTVQNYDLKVTVNANDGGGTGSASGTAGAPLSPYVKVQAIPTTTAVTSSLNPSMYGDSVTFTATVTRTTGSGTPTGSVNFSIAGIPGSPAGTPGATTATTATWTYTTSALDVGTHSVTANYVPSGSFGSSSGSLSGGQLVNKATPTATLSVNNSPVNYNGSPQAATFSITSSVPGSAANVKYNASSIVPTNSGSYVVTADFVPNDTANYNTVPGLSAGNFVINMVTPSFSAPTATPNPIDCGTASVTVSGQLSAGTGSNQVAPVGQTVYITVAGAPTVTTTVNNNPAGTFSATVTTSGLTAGSHTITYHYVGDGANFNNATDNTSTSLTVNNCIADTTLTVATASGTYGGTVNLSATLTKTSDSTPVSGKSISFTLNGNSVGSANTDSNGLAKLDNVSLCGLAYKINFGSYPTGVGASFAGDSSYNGSNGSNSLDVAKASLTITATTNTKTYDCTTSALATPTVNGTKCSDTVTGLAEEYANANAGTGKTLNVTSYTVNDGNSGNNYTVNTVPDNNGVINRANVTFNVTGYSVTYDCSEHKATGTVKGVCNDDLSLGLDFSGTAHTNAVAAHTDTVYYNDSTGNYNNSSTTVTDEIKKADVTFTVTGYSVTYDCSEHKATGTVKGVCNDDLSLGLDFSGTAHTNAVAAHTDTVYYNDSTGNYNNSSTTVTDEIKKANATINITPYNVTYDYNAHTATGTATGVCNDSLSGLDLSGTTHTLPGDYNDSWTFTDGTGNYNNASGTLDTLNLAHDIIHYGTCGGSVMGGVILPPINADGTSVFKKGNTIPVKFTVCDVNGNPISNPAAVFAGTGGTITLLSKVRGTIDGINEASVNDVPDVAFRFTGSQWIFNMSSSTITAGYTYTFRINLAYGSITFMVATK